MSQQRDSHVTEWAALLGERVAEDASDRVGTGERRPDRPDSRTDRPERPTGS